MLGAKGFAFDQQGFSAGIEETTRVFHVMVALAAARGLIEGRLASAKAFRVASGFGGRDSERIPGHRYRLVRHMFL